jgi:hydrogenase maturation protease
MQKETNQGFSGLFNMQSIADTSMDVETGKSCTTGRILVLGLGNILLKDEGIGVHVAQELQRMALPCNVEVIDGGTAGLDVLLLAQGVEKLVVIDALRAGKEAGTIYKAQLKLEDYDELEQIFRGGNKISLHQAGLIDALAAVRRTGCAPKEIVIIGVEPQAVDVGLELSDKLKHKLAEIIDTVLKEIEDAVHRK